MQKTPIPQDEDKRMLAVLGLNILNTETEERFDVLTRRAVSIFHVPISTVSIIDSNREWFKSCQGIDYKEGPRENSFCGHAMLSDIVFIIEDTLKDERFKDNPYVVNYPYIRFYAGVSLRDHKTRQKVGVFCIKDIRPRKMSVADINNLLDLAHQAEIELNKK